MIKNNFDFDYSDLYWIFLERIRVYINSELDFDYSIDFYDRIYGQWLDTSIVFIKEQLKNNLNDELEIFDFNHIKLPNSTKDFFFLIRESESYVNEFRKLLNKSILEEEVPAILFEKSKLLDLNNTNSLSLSLKLRILKLLERCLPIENYMYLTQFSMTRIIQIFFKTYGKTIPFISSTIPKFEPQLKSRKKLLIKPISQDDLIYNIIVLYLLPIELFEGLPNMLIRARKRLDKIKPKRIVTSVGWIWNTEFAIWASLSAEKYSSYIYGLQHGGTYGQVNHLNCEIFERRFSDYFLTWGWLEDDSTIAVSAPRLMDLGPRNILFKGTKILWVTTLDSQVTYFTGDILYGQRFEEYFEHQKEVFGIIPFDLKWLCVRLYPLDFGWNIKDKWLSLSSDISISDSMISFKKDVSNSKLVIIDHIGGTTFLECLRLDIPVVIIAEKSLFGIRKGAKDFFDLLIEASILFTNLDKARLHLSNIYDNPLKWWNHEVTKNAKANFMKNQGFVNDLNPLKDWINVLSSDAEKRF